MKSHEIMDFIQKKINSILFRIVLIAFAIVLVIFHENVFNKYAYILGTIVYFSIFFFLTKYSKVRLLNDFVYINFILLGKNPNDIMVFTFLILPIINSINFSGTKKSFLLYILIAITFINQLCYFNHIIKPEYVISNLHPLIIIFFLWLINSYTDKRLKLKSFREELISVVDDFYLNNEEIQKPHKIYRQLIKVINENTNKIVVEDIVCFAIHKEKIEKLIITNSSSFLWKFNFEKKDIIEEIRKKKLLLNVDLTIDGKRKLFNLMLYTRVQEQEYIFIISTKKTLPQYYLVIGFFDRTLMPAFRKISNVLLSEKKLQEIRNDEITRLSQKSQYVSRANKTMHHIRNRLGPFSNLIKMLENLDSIPPDKIESFKTLIIKETETARTELASIINRANNMLEKNNNPFVYTNLIYVSIRSVFTTLKRNMYNYFPNVEIVIDLQIDISLNKKRILVNEEGFELFLSDWLNNISKYKKNIVDCKFTVTESALEISFSNDYNSSKIEIEKLISDLTSDDRNEIMRRTTHGLYTIKSTLEEMNIPFEASHNDIEKKIILKLTFKTYDYENSNL